MNGPMDAANETIPQIPLPQDFYARSARSVAQALLGKRLVRLDRGRRIAGIIVEAEAYCDAEEPDLACHGTANRGQPTRRTEVMFGPAGFAYVYFTYGMHWMLNIVTGQVGRPNAVLLRALEPVEGEDLMAQRRAPRPRKLWTNGPGKLAQALDIDKRLNGHNLFAGNGLLWVEADLQVSSSQVCSGPRVGLGKTPEPWFSKPWRYWIDDNPYVSGYR